LLYHGFHIKKIARVFFFLIWGCYLDLKTKQERNWSIFWTIYYVKVLQNYITVLPWRISRSHPSMHKPDHAIPLVFCSESSTSFPSLSKSPHRGHFLWLNPTETAIPGPLPSLLTYNLSAKEWIVSYQSSYLIL
jgi:hypothetical protein